MFGVERISNLAVTDEIFTPDKNINPLEYFENIVGVDYSDLKAEKIILSFTRTQGKYVKTLPIHKSQKILVDNEDEFRIELQIVPNYEFMQKILMYNSDVKVIEPRWLVEEIKKC